MLSFSRAEKKLLVLLFLQCICINVLTYMHSKHSCRELWAHWEQSPVHCYKPGLKQWSEKTLQDLKWKHRMDGSRIAVGFMPYYTSALILTAFLLRLEMRAACGEGAVLHYLSLSPVWAFCSSTRQPRAELCAPDSTEMRGFGHRQGLWVAARAWEPLPCKASKPAEYLWFCAFRVASPKALFLQNNQGCNFCALCLGSLCFARFGAEACVSGSWLST